MSTKPKNLKKVIVSVLFKDKTIYKQYPTWEQAFDHFLENQGITKADFGNPGYFKYFFTHGIKNKGYDDIHSKFYAEAQKYIDKDSATANRALAETVTRITADQLEIKTFSPGRAIVNEDMFKVFSAQAEIDEIFSDDLGAMAACCFMITGGPGVGKSTLLFWWASRIREFYPQAKIAIVSSEMEEEDLLYEARKKPWMKTLDFVLASDHGENLDIAIAKIFDEGYDIIILDSFADVCEKLKDFCKMTMSRAENTVLELMKKAKGGKNKTGKFTLTLAIQQVTKGGTFVGSNKLKHNTTGMLELRRESSGDRYAVFTKNRRCGSLVGKKLYYFLGQNNQISFDTDRWEREKEDTNENPTLAQGGMNNRMLTQFGQLDAESANRLRLLLLQDGINEELVNSLKRSNEAIDFDESELNLPEGLNVNDIYKDDGLGFFVLELGPGKTPLFGQSVGDIHAQLIELYGQHSEEEMEEDDAEE